MKFERIVELRLNNFEIKYPEKKKLEDEGGDPCWEGYEQIGMKELDGKMVPNCVPIEKQKKVKEGFPIPSPEGESEEEYISKCMKAIGGEYETQEQALAVCYAQLEK